MLGFGKLTNFVFLCIILQANKVEESYKVPLSTFYIMELTNKLGLAQDLRQFWHFSEIEVE